MIIFLNQVTYPSPTPTPYHPPTRKYHPTPIPVSHHKKPVIPPHHLPVPVAAVAPAPVLKPAPVVLPAPAHPVAHPHPPAPYHEPYLEDDVSILFSSIQSTNFS